MALSTLIDETLAHASMVSEMWTGTPWEGIIDARQAQLIKTVDSNDTDKANRLVLDLAWLLQEAEEEYDNEY